MEAKLWKFMAATMSWTDEEIMRPLTEDEREWLRERFPGIDDCVSSLFGSHSDCGPGCALRGEDNGGH